MLNTFRINGRCLYQLSAPTEVILTAKRHTVIISCLVETFAMISKIYTTSYVASYIKTQDCSDGFRARRMSLDRNKAKM